jgi:hypothetical protein
MSPSLTLSPTFFNQDATVPGHVSLKRGIVTTTPKDADSASWCFFSSFVVSDGVGAFQFQICFGFRCWLSINAATSSPSFTYNSVKNLCVSSEFLYSRVPSLGFKFHCCFVFNFTQDISFANFISYFLSQVATVPSVIVSLKRGIVIIVAIIYSLWGMNG